MALPRIRRKNQAVRSRKRKLKRTSLEYGSEKDGKDYRPHHRADAGDASIKFKKPRNIIPRPDKRNLRDPFHILDDDVVYLIVDQLSVKDTEMLRRVSKLWKASSEAHCGRNALQKHFPTVAAKLGKPGPREEENLRFRRCLYHRESLSRGYATRAVRCTGAVDWQVKHDALVWSNTRGDISIRRLRNPGDQSFLILNNIAISFLDFGQPFASIRYVQLTEGGKMVVVLSLPQVTSSEVSKNVILKMTTTGEVLWRQEVGFPLEKPAIGKTAGFLVCATHSWDAQNATAVVSAVALVKVSLEDGSILSSIARHGSYSLKPAAANEKNLRLTKDEKYVFWRDPTFIHVYCAETGQEVFIHNRYHSNITAPIDKSKHTVNADYSFYDHLGTTRRAKSYASRFTFNESSCAIQTTYVYFPRNGPFYCEDWFFAGDHSAFFSLGHTVYPNKDFEQRFLGQHEQTDSSTNLWVAPMDLVPESGFRSIINMNEKGRQSRISLPSLSGKLDRSRILEADLPWKVTANDFLGIENEYLVYHAPADELLLLVDFWPSW